ncbi:heme/hemin ABC transporter substrate-binding protein [Roseibium litorale]|uniref:ABC transporter substrate-binding protein n=1 Tax=Roseibium litorale TaxID=2803841 RepID=A0ABR9CG64_9HYPH|nr:ABC transporter substrate-binding protein [Roseibium litorale]MBD8889919.1 ABC transporter substrate-binding protein [Roseibium litorale]
MRRGFLTAFGLPVLALLAMGAASAKAESLTGSRKIVSIGGSITEIVYALGGQDRLAARDSTSLYPPEALSLPDAGYMRALSPEGVLSVDPDGILLLEGSGPPETLSVLKSSGLPIVEVPEDFSAEGILKKVETVGAALGLEEKAAALKAKLAADLAEAQEEGRTKGHGVRVMFILSAQGGRIMASGSGTAAAGILKLAGAVNAVEGYSGYKQLTDEAVISAAPDVILMMDRAGNHASSAEEVLASPALQQTPAGQNKHLIRMEGLYLLGFGPRTADAVRELVRELAKSGS